MRVVFLVSGKKWSAEAAYALRMARAMRADGHDISIFTRHKDAVQQPFVADDFDTGTLRLGGAWDFLTPVRLGRHLEGCPDEAIAIHTANFRDAYTALAARRLYHGSARIAVVKSCLDRMQASVDASARKVYGELDAIIFPSAVRKEHFLATNPPVAAEKLHIVPDCLGLDAVAEPDCAHAAPVRLIYPGPITQAIGLTTLFHALDRLPDFDWRLEICGTGRGSTVMPLVRYERDWTLGSRLSWAGDCDDMAKRLAAADICVVPAADAPLIQRQILESFAAGTPVIAARADISADVITDGSDGLLVSQGNEAEMVDALRRLMADETLRKTLADNALAALNTRFDARAALNSLSTIFRKACQ